jgi:signal transduction histidine kinase
VVIGLEQTPKNILISVSNEGSYISDEEQKSLFQPFQRAPTAEVSKIKGWGIGLTLVKSVTEAHGGSVSVRSDVTLGTVFTVTLPRGE